MCRDSLPDCQLRHSLGVPRPFSVAHPSPAQSVSVRLTTDLAPIVRVVLTRWLVEFVPHRRQIRTCRLSRPRATVHRGAWRVRRTPAERVAFRRRSRTRPGHGVARVWRWRCTDLEVALRGSGGGAAQTRQGRRTGLDVALHRPGGGVARVWRWRCTDPTRSPHGPGRGAARSRTWRCTVSDEALHRPGRGSRTEKPCEPDPRANPPRNRAPSARSVPDPRTCHTRRASAAQAAGRNRRGGASMPAQA